MNRCQRTATLHNIRRAVPRLPAAQRPKAGADYVIMNLIRKKYWGIRKLAKSLGVRLKIRHRRHFRDNGAKWGHLPARKVTVR